MTSRVIAVYNGDLDKLMRDFFIHEKLVKVWKKKHKEYIIDLKIEIDENSFYTLSLECKKR